MENQDRIYRKLQQHLDQQAVGFPATKSGAEIRLLKHIFTPDEAEIAICMSHACEPVDALFQRARHLADSPESLEIKLKTMMKKGGIDFRIKDGIPCYGTAPLVVGMYELQVGRLTPEFIADFKVYLSERAYQIEFISTALPQMRTIPVEKSLEMNYPVSTFDAVQALLKQAEPPFVVVDCICRKKQVLEGHHCQITSREETCLAMGNAGTLILNTGAGREITFDEMLSILEENQREGMVIQPSNSQKPEFICSCCGCCCGMLKVHKALPKPLKFWAANYYAAVDVESCIGCGLCQERCQIGAVAITNENKAEVDLERCFGCGLCVTVCSSSSLSLKKRETQIQPPKTRDDLYERIMEGKKSRLGKLNIAGQVVVDAIRTGRKC